MSLLSSIIIPRLEAELLAMSPELSQFLLSQIKICGREIVDWAEKKMNVDLNGDGIIGEA